MKISNDTFQINTSIGIIFAVINGPNSLYIGTDNRSGKPIVEGLIYRKEYYQFNTHCGRNNHDSKKDFSIGVTTVDSSGTSRLVRDTDSNYYRFRNIYSKKQGGFTDASESAKHKFYDIVLTEVNQYINQNKSLFAAAWLERLKNDYIKSYKGKEEQVNKLQKEIDGLETDMTILADEFRQKFKTELSYV